MDSPRVSVILPAHNREATIRRAVDSVLAQTFENFELLLVDDASIDSTPEILQSYASDSRVRVIVSEKNLGGAGARNLGISEARADLIAFQDSDDYWMPDKLAEQVKALEAAADVGLCYCGALYSGGIGKAYYLPSHPFSHYDGDMSRKVLDSSPASTQTILVRRTLLESCGNFDPDLKRYQDWDLVIRLAQASHFVFIEKPLAVVYDTPGNISSVSVNDAIFRSRLLEKYATLFESAPEARARHHYIAGRVWQKAGQPAKAASAFAKSIQASPGSKAVFLWFITWLHGFRGTRG